MAAPSEQNVLTVSVDGVVVVTVTIVEATELTLGHTMKGVRWLLLSSSPLADAQCSS